MAESQNGGNPQPAGPPPQHLNLNQFGTHAADDPEMTDRRSMEAQVSYQEMAKLRNEAWDQSVKKIMLTGSNGYISEQLGEADDRPALTQADREQLMRDYEGRAFVTYPADDSAADQLPDRFENIFSGSSSASVDSPEDAARFLEIDVHTGRISDQSTLVLRPDQIQNVAFMIKNGESVLRGCINANASGTGKTIEGLATIYFLAKRNTTRGEPRYSPNLILCSPAAMKSWQRDYNSYFRPGNLLYLHVCNSRGAGSADDIKRTIESLGPSDPKTGTHIFAFTYATFASLFLTKKDKKLVLHKKPLSNHRAKLTEERIEAFRTAEKAELFDLNLTAGIFGICIADEAHNIKDPKTQKAHTVYLAEASINFLLTASPINNRVSDLRGLLCALFRSKEWQLNWPRGWTEDDVCNVAFDAAFNPYQLVDGKNIVPDDTPDDYKEALRHGQQLWCLNPALYRWLGHQFEFKGRFTEEVVGLIFRTCVLCRSQDDILVSEDGEKVGNVAEIRNIPACAVKTIEVGMTDDERDFYRPLSQWWFKSIYGSDTRNFKTAARMVSRNEMPKAGFNKSLDWRLRCLTMSPGLAQIARLKTTIPEIVIHGQRVDFDGWAQRNTDLGVSFFYHLNRRDDDEPNPPAGRRAMIDFMLRGSPKMRWLLPKLWEWKTAGEKVIIFIVHPLTQWLIERVCLLIGGFNFLSVDSSLVSAARAQVFADFSDPTKSYEFIIVPMSIGGTSIELQNDCHRAIIFELPESFPITSNAIGRIHRVGQKHEQEVLILTVEDSYDDFTLWRMFRKYSKDLCGKHGFVEVADRITWPAGFDDLVAKVTGASAKEILAGELIRRKFGVQWNSLGNARDGEWRHLYAYFGKEYLDMTELGRMLYQMIVGDDEEDEDDEDEENEEDAG